MLLVAAVVVALQYGRIGGPVPPQLPADAPPSGVDLVYTRNPAEPHGLIAFDWAGTRRGSIKFPTWVEISRLRPSPNGSEFMIDPSTPGDYAAYFDRFGRVLFETNEDAFMSQVWADDSAHVCMLTGDGLVTRLPGEPDRVAHADVSGAFTVTGCTLGTNAAILTSEDRVEVARLSDGQVIGGADLPAGAAGVASADAAYIAVSAIGTEPVKVYRTSGLSTPVAELDAGLTPLAFSGDDSILFAGTTGRGPLEAIAWRTGAEAWSFDPSGANVDAVAVRPAAADFAVYLSTGTMLIRRDGKSTKLR